MNCPELDDLIAAAMSPDGATRVRVQEHARTCTRCAAEMQSLGMIARALRPSERISDSLVEQVMERLPSPPVATESTGSLRSVRHGTITFLLGVVTVLLGIVFGGAAAAGLGSMLAFSVAIGLVAALAEPRIFGRAQPEAYPSAPELGGSS